MAWRRLPQGLWQVRRLVDTRLGMEVGMPVKSSRVRCLAAFQASMAGLACGVAQLPQAFSPASLAEAGGVGL